MALPQRPSHIIKPKTGPDDPELQAELNQALAQVASQDVIAIADELAERHERLFRRLRQDASALAASWPEIASAVTHTRTHAQTLRDYFAQRHLAPLEQLLGEDGPPAERLARFVEQVPDLEIRLAVELASGLLHNTFPQECWLWTRWLWDPSVGTGILPLLAGSTHNLWAADLAEGYRRVGKVTRLSAAFGERTGLLGPELTGDARCAPFAQSAFLACAYCVYLYGVTGWRLSREFHALLPALPDLARRLLGLRKRPGAASPRAG